MAGMYKPGDEYKVRVSKAYIRNFADQLDAINKAANKTIFNELQKASLIEKLEFYTELDFETVATIMDRTCGAATKLSSALTCRFYDGIRDASNISGAFKAELYEGYSSEKIRAAAYSIMEEVAEGKNTVPLVDLLQNVSNREIKNAADATVRHNVRKDPSKPRYAIVPGGDACAFCQMRASLGYTYADEGAVDSHDHCTCTATPVFGNQRIEGYNPDEYRARYDEARTALSNGDIPDEMKERFEREREAKGKDFDKTNQILAVMRYQQGIS